MLFVFCIELDVKLYSLGRLLVTQIRSRNNSPSFSLIRWHICKKFYNNSESIFDKIEPILMSTDVEL